MYIRKRQFDIRSRNVYWHLYLRQYYSFRYLCIQLFKGYSDKHIIQQSYSFSLLTNIYTRQLEGKIVIFSQNIINKTALQYLSYLAGWSRVFSVESQSTYQSHSPHHCMRRFGRDNTLNKRVIIRINQVRLFADLRFWQLEGTTVWTKKNPKRSKISNSNKKFEPFHSQSQEVHSPNLKQEKCISEVVRIGSIIIFHLSKLWKAKFFILCDVIFLVRLQGKIEIVHSWEWKG